MRALTSRAPFIAVVTVTAALGAGMACSDDEKSNANDRPDGGAGTGGSGGSDSGACKVTVCPSADDHEALQTALIKAKSGDTITLGKGVYKLDARLTLTGAEGITLTGETSNRDDVLLDFTAQNEGAEGILVETDNFKIENLSIKNTKGNGIKVQADNSIFRNIKVGWDDNVETRGAYAVYPTGCKKTLMENNEVYNAWDAGIYAGQCENVIARGNKAYGNVLGIEIENTTNADVYDNEMYNNTCGLLLDLLPNLAKKDNRNYLIRNNIIRDNNLANFAQEGTTASFMPKGTGVLVLAASDIEIRNNTISGHEGAPVSIVSYDIIDVIMEFSGGTPPDPDPGTNRWPERIHVHDNTFTNNGTKPEGIYALLGSLTDAGASLPFNVLWDGKIAPTRADGGAGDAGSPGDGGTRGDADVQICLGAAERSAFLNFNLAKFPDGPISTDPTPHTCTLDPIPELTP